jgi:phage internal scaffolding protein
MTKQSFKDECDIHKILKQYQRTGVINHIANARPTYMDLPDTMDYQASMNTIIYADEAFATLPSSVRDHFGNDPARFLAAFSDIKQRDYLIQLGLYKPPATAEAIPDPVRPPSPEPG